MSYYQILSSLPIGLERAVLGILSKRVGVQNAVKKGELTALLSDVGFKVKDERHIRLVISKLRKDGVLIGSTNTDGYWMIADMKEFALVKAELLSRVKDIVETTDIMEKSAKAQFGDGWQEGLPL